MKHERPSDECQEKAALYALGTLTQHEALAFEAHLREGCTVCKILAEHFAKIVSAAGYGCGEVEAPAYLRDLLAARVERETPPSRPPEPRSTTGASQPAATPADAELDRAPAYTSSLPLPPRQPAVLPWILVLLFAAAAATATWFWNQARSIASWESQKAADAHRMVEESQATLASERLRTREFGLISAALAGSATQIIALKGQDSAPSAAATIFWDTIQSRWILSASLPPAPPGKEYQLWYISGNARTSAALLKQDAEGHSFASIEVPPTATALTGAAISLEQSGGAEKPGRIYALGKICP